MMKVLQTSLLALGLGFLLFLIWRSGLRHLAEQMTMLGWGIVPIVGAEGLAELLHAIGWRSCMSGSNRRIPLARLFRIHLAGYAVNYVTPTASLAGEVTKAALLAGPGEGPKAVTSVLANKVSFALGQVLFVVIGLGAILPRLQSTPALRGAMLLGGGALAFGIVAFLFLQRTGKLGSLIRWLARRNPRSNLLSRTLQSVEQIDSALKLFHQNQPGDFARSVFWHFVGFLIGIPTVWYFLWILVGGPPVGIAAGIWCLTLWCDLVTFAVPLNLGVLEGGRLVAFRVFGYEALAGMTFGIVTRVAQLVWTCIGLVSYVLLVGSSSTAGRRMRRKAVEPAEQIEPIRE